MYRIIGQIRQLVWLWGAFLGSMGLFGFHQCGVAPGTDYSSYICYGNGFVA